LVKDILLRFEVQVLFHGGWMTGSAVQMVELFCWTLFPLPVWPSFGGRARLRPVQWGVVGASEAGHFPTTSNFYPMSAPN
jgi:hypothetical protein